VKTVYVVFFTLLVLSSTKVIDQRLLSSEALLNSVVIFELVNNIFALRENWHSYLSDRSDEESNE
jgi:hypothetical protein